MSDLKIPVALVFAMAVQLVALVWYISGMVHDIEHLEGTVSAQEDIIELQKLIKDDNLPFCDGGFFWGHQFQEESMKDYKKIDLKFCKDALKWIKEGKEVWYDCWW